MKVIKIIKREHLVIARVGYYMSLRTSVNNNDILWVQWDITCLYPKGLSVKIKNVLILSLLYLSFEAF